MQGHLLQKTECEITDEAARLDEMNGQAVQSAECDAGKNDRCDEDRENRDGELGGGFEIVCAPAESFGRVATENEAEEEPSRKDEPGTQWSALPAPNVEEDDGRESERFEEIGEGRDGRARRLHT